MYNETSILKTENLVVGYGNHPVLSGVTFNLQKGQVLAIIGRNGTGKSTLMKTLGGLLPFKSGNIWMQNEIVNEIHPHSLIRKGVSLFLQGGLVLSDLTILEHIELAVLQSRRKLQKTVLDNIFTEFPKLKGMQNQKAGNLSGGERQILSLAILVLQKSRIWLLDEATSGLAPEMVRTTTEFLQKKKQEGITMLIVEHNMEVAFNLASHIVVAKQGTLTKQFHRAEFLKNDFLEKVVYN